MAEKKDTFLSELGLDTFWDKKIKPLIYKKATLREDLTVKNPRVEVADEVKDHTFRKGETLEDVLNYLYRNVIAEAQPNKKATLPTITVNVKMDKSTAELNEVIGYTVSQGTFNKGTIGTCAQPWEEEAHQVTVGAGSSVKSGTFKVYVGDSNNTENMTEDETQSGETVKGSITINTVGANAIGKFYSCTVDYTASTTPSVTSYNKAATPVEGTTFFNEGTTARATAVTGSVTGYKPSFGNISASTTSASTGTISNLGNKYNSRTTTDFYYGPTDTTGTNNTSFEIYFPAEFTGKVEYYDTITREWAEVATVVTASHFATLPAGSTTANYPNGSLESGVEYKLIRQATGGAYGPRQYRLTLS